MSERPRKRFKEIGAEGRYVVDESPLEWGFGDNALADEGDV